MPSSPRPDRHALARLHRMASLEAGGVQLIEPLLQELRRVELKAGKLVSQEILFKDLGRIRHVIGGPDGALYVLLPTRIARIVPAE